MILVENACFHFVAFTVLHNAPSYDTGNDTGISSDTVAAVLHDYVPLLYAGKKTEVSFFLPGNFPKHYSIDV
jgi:hypothetical protein